MIVRVSGRKQEPARFAETETRAAEPGSSSVAALLERAAAIVSSE